VIDRRRFLAALPTLALPVAGIVRAQPAKTPAQIGFLRIVAPPRLYIDAFEAGLRDRGLVPGRAVDIDYRFARGSEAELDGLARELVARGVVVIVVAGNQAVRAARAATKVTPIVMAVANDPVASGFVATLSRPGGNVTGTTLLSSALAGKRLALLRELLPQLSRVAVLLNADNAAHGVAWKETQAAAARLAVAVHAYEVQGAASLERAFARMTKAREEALVVAEDALFLTERTRLAGLAQQARLPAVYGQRNSVDDGGLMSYGPNIESAYRNAGTFIDRILKGAKPAELPVEQPTRFELVINLKTARAFGLVVPQSMLLSADEVIQ
jgi:putative ABC transport system substrate-binding protein